MELEHIDGNNKNNERNNLEAICPNCHSLNKTWRGKNVRKNTTSDDDFLKKLLINTNIHQSLIDLNLSPKGNNYRRAKRILEKYYLENKKT